MSELNTHLAGKYYVLSALHRIGIDAHLTPGKEKACDIVAIRKDQTLVTVEVKAFADSYDWRADILDTVSPGSHNLAIVCFDGNIKDTTKSPTVWIVPFAYMDTFIRVSNGTKNVSLAAVLKFGNAYRSAWNYISGVP
jgi:hypothetical protein